MKINEEGSVSIAENFDAFKTKFRRGTNAMRKVESRRFLSVRNSRGEKLVRQNKIEARSTSER